MSLNNLLAFQHFLATKGSAIGGSLLFLYCLVTLGVEGELNNMKNIFAASRKSIFTIARPYILYAFIVYSIIIIFNLLQPNNTVLSSILNANFSIFLFFCSAILYIISLTWFCWRKIKNRKLADRHNDSTNSNKKLATIHCFLGESQSRNLFISSGLVNSVVIFTGVFTGYPVKNIFNVTKSYDLFMGVFFGGVIFLYDMAFLYMLDMLVRLEEKPKNKDNETTLIRVRWVLLLMAIVFSLGFYLVALVTAIPMKS